jgi:hypothetical protein
MTRQRLTSYLMQGTVAAFVTVTAVACDTDLAGLNQNPDHVEDLVPEYMFTNALLSGVAISFQDAYRMYGQSMQIFATHFEVTAPGDKYFNENGARSGWSYTGALSQNELVLRSTEEDPASVNKHTAARIWRVYLFHHVTDLFGDIPYSESLRAAEGLQTPRYDRQEDIYLDMLNELEEAANAFDPTLPTMGTADLLYGGNIDQWRKFAYSLMLRLAMRLTDARPDLSEHYVRTAIAGGVISEDADMALVPYTAGGTDPERNPKATALVNGDFSNPQTTSTAQGSKYAETFIDHLKRTNDPRLGVFAVVWLGPEGSKVPHFDPETQRGMKNGAFFGEPDDFETYSEPRRETILNYGAPVLVMTSAEVYLLLAEAAIRGWYEGSAEEAYNNAVRAGMRQWALFGSEGIIAPESIAQYLAENPFKNAGSFEEQLEQISTQKWVSLYLDFLEIYANWRRTDYPKLVPTNYPGNITGGRIPRRRIIPDSEITENEANFREAMERQGVGNHLLSTVWWDPQYPSR